MTSAPTTLDRNTTMTALLVIGSILWLDCLFILCHEKPERCRTTCQPPNGVRRQPLLLPRSLNYIQPVNTA